MLDRNFNFAEAEGRIYAAWEMSGAFRPSNAPGAEPYTIVIPPPNVTGSLHMGHALNNTLQDALIRFERMRGKSVLWQPGTDHAGIATQMVVERQLAESGANQDRRSMGRDAFVERVWEWKETSGGRILNQLKRLGASCDWSRERFTMDEGLSKAVLKVFVQLYREGLIYRDKRLVNWDPKFETAISDLEVDNREVDGHFWHFKYPLEHGKTYEFPIEHDKDGNPTKWETRDYISIATTRPETMLGDGAVAVHPGDKRYAPLVGKRCLLPLAERYIPIIADDYPDPDFGSGAVKITGAHDFNDYEIARRHDLKLYELMDTKGCMLDADYIPAKYHGLDRYEAREAVVADIKAQGLLIEVEDKKITQPFGDRSGVVIEPMLTDQWYVDAKTLARPAIKAVEEGRTTFVPENWTKTYYQWMRNIQPWCVSRQLWWGHRIPAWYGPDGHCFVAETEEEASKEAIAKYTAEGYSLEEINDMRRHEHGGAPLLVRDEDVLDTWFSSALWPFSTLGWPDGDSPLPLGGEGQGVRGTDGAADGAPETIGAALTPDPSPAGGRGETAPGRHSILARHYPTSVLVTAFDIIFFWVARMMMMGLHFMKDEHGKAQIPFKDVYIHALVLDEHGQKMSKSKGNVVDPLVLIEKYGADALRFTLAAQAAQGRNIRLSEARVEGYRNFGTKLWNAARFCQMNECRPASGFDPASAQTTLNRWIVHETNECASAVTRALEAYRFNEAAGAIYRFIWHVFCDWYLELAKPALQGEDGAEKTETRAAAAWSLDQILKLLHPFMPFITEELWGAFDRRDSALITAPWPQHDAALINEAAATEFNWTIDLISSIRSIRQEMNIPPKTIAKLMLVAGNPTAESALLSHKRYIERLARVEVVVGQAQEKGSIQIVHRDSTFALPLKGIIDVAAERLRLDKEIAKAAEEIVRIDKKLANKNFIERAPAEVVEEQKTRRADYQAQREKLSAALARLEGL